MRPRILIVDDEEPILFAMAEYFRASGFEVDCASEMEEAAALVNRVRYALVITDLRLTKVPGTEGLQLIQEIHGRVPVIMLTAYGSPDVETWARAQGIAAFLTKPTSLSAIRDKALALIGGPVQ